MNPVPPAPSPLPLPLPLVGRGPEVTLLRELLDGVEGGRGGILTISGPEGSGRSRLGHTLLEEAERRGAMVGVGTASPLDVDLPRGLFCDLFEPLLRPLPPEARQTLTRGAPEFALLCPALAECVATPPVAGDEGDLKGRLLWNIVGFLDRFRRGRPLVLLFEDVEWADASSLELLHFLARRAQPLPLLLALTLDPARPGREEGVGALLRGIDETGRSHRLSPGPLSREDVVEALASGFRVSEEVVRPTAELLHHWTGGNPLYLNAAVEHLLREGQLRVVGEQWTGWGHSLPRPPSSIRAMIVGRLQRLSPEARGVAELVAVAGPRARYALLRELAGLPEEDLLSALRELREAVLLEELPGEGGRVVHRFLHPLVQEVVHEEVGLSRARVLHGRVALALEALLGDDALERAGELAPHFLLAGSDVDPVQGIRYLTAAGAQALRAHANNEAERFWRGAHALAERIRNGPEPAGKDPSRTHPSLQGIRMEWARSLQRLGRLEEARELLQRGLSEAERADDPAGEARFRRRLGIGSFLAGDPHEALAHWTEGLGAARRAGSPRAEARLRLACSACLQETGRHEDALADAHAALALGEEARDLRLQLAAHRALLLLHTWSGPPGPAREHGARALAFAERMGDPWSLASVRWALAVLEGLTGNARGVRASLDAGWEAARGLDAPSLHLQLMEVEIEYAAGVGAWDRASDLALEAVERARFLHQDLMLPRLLISSALIRLGRGEVEEAKRDVEEARERVDGSQARGPAATHLAVQVHAGRAALHSALGQWGEAIRLAEAGLEIADRGGYTAWGLYRLLPLMGEAALQMRDLERAARVTRRLRRDSEWFEHGLAGIWADAGDALIAWLSGDVERGAERMARVAHRLEAVDSIPDAARMRRQLAGRLVELGDRDAAIRELRRVHDVLARLGAGPELEKARGQFREVGARPPALGRSGAREESLLSEREVEIARLVAQRLSNKAIGRILSISPRTVGTHLSNIYRKLGVNSRARLGDLVRTGEIPH